MPTSILISFLILPLLSLACTNDSFIVPELLRTHNRRKVPGNPVVVTVEIWVQDISRILEVSSEFELDIYVTEQWVDDSLAYYQYDPCKSNLSLKADMVLKQIWSPNSVFVNSKNASIHDSPYRNIFLMFYANGTVWLNYRIKLTGPCVKDLKTFPIDEQRCMLTYESFYHNNQAVQMIWTQNPVSFLKNIQLPDYEINTSAVEIMRVERVRQV